MGQPHLPRRGIQLHAATALVIAQLWRPGAENFFDRIKKSQILGILGQFDAELALRYATAKKTELASAAARLCAGDTIIEPEIKARAIAWVPGAMCFVDTGSRVDADPDFDDGEPAGLDEALEDDASGPEAANQNEGGDPLSRRRHHRILSMQHWRI